MQKVNILYQITWITTVVENYFDKKNDDDHAGVRLPLHLQRGHPQWVHLGKHLTNTINNNYVIIQPI